MSYCLITFASLDKVSLLQFISAFCTDASNCTFDEIWYTTAHVELDNIHVTKFIIIKFLKFEMWTKTKYNWLYRLCGTLIECCL